MSNLSIIFSPAAESIDAKMYCSQEVSELVFIQFRREPMMYLQYLTSSHLSGSRTRGHLPQQWTALRFGMNWEQLPCNI